MSAFYTRRGDDGTTGLLGAGRVPKYDRIMETLGVVDETTACLGVARAACVTAETPGWILQIQRHLYALMAEVAATPQNVERFRSLGEAQVLWLEELAETVGKKAPAPREFIVPGDTPSGAALDVARAVTRRAERRLAELVESGWVTNPHLLPYLNRLSSLLFALEIYENQVAKGSPPTLARAEGPA